MKLRAAIDPIIEHLERENRMDRNLLKVVLGDRLNAISEQWRDKLLQHAAVGSSIAAPDF